MKKYSVAYKPIIMHVYAESEREAMDTVFSHISSLDFDDFNIDTIDEFEGDEDDFYPVNLSDVFGTCQHDWQYDDSGDGTMVCHLGCGSVKQ